MAWNRYLDAEQERFVNELIELVSIPSVGIVT
ncbi:hypothetical protein FHW16_003032 [Phyllobacterium myrsinacearum]|uniref:Uncharacterized protein n=1 Tax=Phyllobacterium myrsinacearum TaxID=28101 RepID=A0A839EP94_9HYPH|nr:hypothetical protein [Phyllobacterium myrsinacearum]